jgi:taurine dioxygenase
LLLIEKIGDSMFLESYAFSDIFDNSARVYKYIDVRQHSSAMGAEVVHADLTALCDGGIAEFKDALLRHKMIYVRNQRLDDAAQLELTRRLGTPASDAYASDADPTELVTPVIKEADQRVPFVFGGGWHTDSAFLERPPAITVLRSVEVPPVGGDTMWANTALAYRALSPTMQELLAPLRVHMSSGSLVNNVTDLDQVSRGFSSPAVQMQAVNGTFHPLVRSHPDTGEKALYVSSGYAAGIQGMTNNESRVLIDFLLAHITQPPFTCRLKWENEMLALWNNRVCLHLAMNDYDGYRREMHRTMVRGEFPA